MVRHSDPATVHVMTVGVNRDLLYPRKDATDIARALGSSAGLVSPRAVTCLLEVTVAQLRFAMRLLALQAPAYLVFYFAGHGTPTGIVLADGEMTFAELADLLRGTGAEWMLTILDSCHSGGLLEVAGIPIAGGPGTIDPDALRLLLHAAPGNRVICSVAADKLSREGGGIANGHTTAAMLAALERAHGDLDGRRGSIISERRLFAVTKRIMQARGGPLPVALRLRGDFPVIRSQDAAIGGAAIVGAGVVDGTFEATFRTAGRRGLRTTLVVQAQNPNGDPIASFVSHVFPTRSIDQCTFSYPLAPPDAHGDAFSALSMSMHGCVAVQWTLTVLDVRRRVLTRARHAAVYAVAWSPRIWR